MKAKTNLERVLEEGKFAVTAELGPPQGADPGEMVSMAKELKDKADAYNLTDNQTAIVRLSSIGAGIHLQNAGVEPVIQMTVRDRNRIAVQSDILGAYSHGIKNVLCLSGDHQSFGNEQGSKNVYDIDSIQLIWSLKRMRDEGLFIGGDKLTSPVNLFIGAAVNPFADPFEYRVDRLEKKIKAGADFIQTQAIFDMDRFERFMEMVRNRGLHKKVKILAGLIPIKSAGAARYMKNKVSGMIVPDEIIDRIKGAKDKKKEGIKLCIEQIQHLKEVEGVAGVHLMPVAWEEAIPEIVEGAGLLPRP